MIVFLSWLLFDIGIQSSLGPFALSAALFILVNLAIGFMLSTVSKTQLQARYLAFAYLLPATLLSGFMFQFRGMPAWAQILGDMLPVTHFIRISRGLMLKGATFDDIARELAALAAMLVAVSALALSRYRQTLDSGAKPAA
jgi:ABC-2 type transport system permease protein